MTSRVLLVDGDRAAARDIALQLLQHRMVVDVANCGAEALELARLYEYDAAIVDLNLPDMQGYDVVTELRARRVEAPVLMLSTEWSTQAKIRSLAVGANDLLGKQSTSDELVAHLELLIRQYRGFRGYLLDTNAVIAALKNADSLVGARLRQQAPGEVFISAIVLHELFYGAFKSARVERNVTLVERLRFGVLEFSAEDARAAGKLRAALAAKGTPIGPYDVLIAGQALARGLVLVTRNGGEFGRVEGLGVEDWEA